MEHVVNTAFPALELGDEVYVQGLLELILKFLGLDESVLDNPLQPQEYANSLNKVLAGNTDAESKEILDLLSAVLQNSPGSLNYDKEDIQNVRTAAEDVLKQIQDKVEKRLATL